METKVFVGVDVSKDSLDVAISTEKQILTFTNNQKGADSLVKKLSRIGAQLIVFESTGGYERFQNYLEIVGNSFFKNAVKLLVQNTYVSIC